MFANQRIYCLLLSVMAGAGLFAQDDVSGNVDRLTKPFVREFQGSVGGDQQMVMVLVNWGDSSLTGSCLYPGTGRKIELYGGFGQKDHFEIREYGGARQLGMFRGQFLNPDTLQGVWIDSQNERELPFALHGSPGKDTLSPWRGTWYLNDPWDEGMLIIGDVGADSLYFGLIVVRGAHLGQVEGRASVKGKEAFFSTALFGEEPCQFSFALGEGFVDVQQLTGATTCGFGIRAHANGRFEDQARKIVPELAVGTDTGAIFSTTEQRDAFRQMVGEQLYHVFAFNMQGVTNLPATEGDPPGSRSVTGAVLGLFATNQAVLMQDEQGHFWGLTTDFSSADELTIQYVTNAGAWLDRLPPSLEAWYLSSFEGIPLEKRFFPLKD